MKRPSYRGHVVLDPFDGTGTVAVIAKKAGRHFIHVGVLKKYCQIAAERLAPASRESIGCHDFTMRLT